MPDTSVGEFEHIVLWNDFAAEVVMSVAQVGVLAVTSERVGQHQEGELVRGNNRIAWVVTVVVAIMWLHPRPKGAERHGEEEWVQGSQTSCSTGSRCRHLEEPVRLAVLSVPADCRTIVLHAQDFYGKHLGRGNPSRKVEH